MDTDTHACLSAGAGKLGSCVQGPLVLTKLRHGVQEGKGTRRDKARGMESRGWDRDNAGVEDKI